MYTVNQMAHILQRRPKEIFYICKHFKLGYNGVFSENDLAFVDKIANADKEFLIDMVRKFITENPFVTLKQINRHIGKGSPYGDWILTEMTYIEKDLAETDDGGMFYVNEQTIKLLKERGDWDSTLDGV